MTLSFLQQNPPDIHRVLSGDVLIFTTDPPVNPVTEDDVTWREYYVNLVSTHTPDIVRFIVVLIGLITVSVFLTIRIAPVLYTTTRLELQDVSTSQQHFLPLHLNITLDSSNKM